MAPDREATASALAEVFASSHVRLMRALRPHAQTASDVEDALADTYGRILQMSDPAKATAEYVFVCGMRECWRLARERARLSYGGACDSGDFASRQGDPHDAAAERERITLAFAAASHLKPAERDALADQWAGLSMAETAAQRGWTYTKVNRARTEGRAAFRAEMDR